MRPIFWLCLFFASGGIAAAACEDSVPVSQGSAVDGDADSDTDSDSDSDADTDGDADGDADVPSFDIPVCVQSCSDVSDCVPVGADAIHDADNYQCTSGNCVYTGCNSEAECDEAYPALSYVCHATGCLPACSTAADCAFDSPDADEDNYTCDNGACVYLGCLSDAECSSTYGAAYSCQDPMNSKVSLCAPKCTDGTTAACIPTQDSEAYGEDNYTCILEECYYTGCNNDAECGTGYRCLNL